MCFFFSMIARHPCTRVSAQALFQICFTTESVVKVSLVS